MTLSEARNISIPAFIKPVVPKVFRAGVSSALKALETECNLLELTTPIYVSEIVDITTEAMCFIGVSAPNYAKLLFRVIGGAYTIISLL